MKSKFIIISVFVIFLISLCAIDTFIAKPSLNDINESSKEIIEQIQNNVEKDKLLTNLNSTYQSWQDKEILFSLVYNHKDFIEIGKEINQAISYVEVENNEEAYVHMQLLEENIRTLNNIVTFDLGNIF